MILYDDIATLRRGIDASEVAREPHEEHAALDRIQAHVQELERENERLHEERDAVRAVDRHGHKIGEPLWNLLDIERWLLALGADSELRSAMAGAYRAEAAEAALAEAKRQLLALDREKHLRQEEHAKALADMRKALDEACDLIEALADQQAMPDDFYQEPYFRFRALATADSGTGERFKPGDKLPTGETFIGYTEDDTPIWSEPVGGTFQGEAP